MRWTQFALERPSACKNCGAPFEVASYFTGPPGHVTAPERCDERVGSLMVCSTCGVLYEFDGRGNLTKLDAVPPCDERTRKAINDIRAAVFLANTAGASFTRRTRN